MSQREGYKKTEIGWIPDEWDVKSIGDVAKIITGNKDTQNKIENGEYPFFVRSQKIERINSYSFDGEAILTSGDGVGVGKIYHYVNGKFNYHQRVYNIHDFSDEILGRYLFNFFKQNFYRRVMRLSAKNSVDSVRMEMIKDMPIAIPPLPEQQKIASILTTVDDKISSIENKIQQTEQLKKGLMEKLLTEGIGHTEFKDTKIGRIPASWEYKSFQNLINTGDVVNIQDGNHGEIHPKTADFVDDGIPFIMANCFFYNRLRIDKANRISEEQYNSLRIGFSYPDDVLLTHKGTVGMTAIVYPENGRIMLTPQVTSYRLDKKSKLLKEYLFYYFQSPYYQKTLANISKQSTRAYIGITAQKKLNCVLPPLEEQKQIASILSTVDDKIEVLTQKKDQYQTLKKGLSQQLLTGQMRVKV